MEKKMWVVGITSVQADFDPELRGPYEEDIDLFTVLGSKEEIGLTVEQLNDEYENKFVKRHGHAPGDGMYDDYVQFYYAALPEQIGLYELRSKLIKEVSDSNWKFDKLFN